MCARFRQLDVRQGRVRHLGGGLLRGRRITLLDSPTGSPFHACGVGPPEAAPRSKSQVFGACPGLNALRLRRGEPRIRHTPRVPDTPTWSLAADAAGKGLAALAIASGGLLGYWRYVRGRVFHAKLSLDLTVEPCFLMSRPAIKVVATILNDGTCRVGFPDWRGQQLQLAACYVGPWERACAERSDLEWNDSFYEYFAQEGDCLIDLEPGQRHVKQTFLPGVLAPRPVAYRVRLYVEGRPKPWLRYKDHEPWSTERVMEVFE